MDKYRLSLIVIGVLAAGILLGAFFVGVQPQLDRIGRAETQTAAAVQQNTVQEARNAALAADNERIDEYRGTLETNRTQIPADRAQQPMIDQIHAAAAAAGVTVTTLTSEAAVTYTAPTGVDLTPPASGTLVQVPVTLSASGDRAALEQFAANVQRSARIFTVTGSQYSGPDEPTLTLTGATWVLKPAQ